MQVISGKMQTAKKVAIYGPEGVGKTSLAAQFPKPIFLDVEGSTTELVVDRLPKPSSWQMLEQQVDWAKNQIGTYKTLIIDTADWAEKLCANDICSKQSKKGIEDFGYGKGYVYLSEEFGRFLNKLSNVVELGMHVVLVAHSQIVKFEQPDEMGNYDRYQLKLEKKVAPLVKEWADLLLFVNYKTFSVAADEHGKKHKAQGGRRVIYTTHHPAWDAKNRQGLPDELPLDYGAIAHVFETGQVQQQSISTQQPVIQEPVNPAPQQQPAPIEQPVQQPTSTPTAPVQQSQPAPQQEQQKPLDPNIPASLRDLMQQHGVGELDIQVVVGQKGYYPIDTPIVNYDPGFIEGVLVSAWPQVHQMVLDYRENLPF
ncbi:AAA family ATPase [Sporosarcina sp. SAFN-010]|uniref:ATP-binding protein n=1 Tax=Sporosarcina sp. SAFN-010 TaxID=3387273 RepID=UPI003F811413